MATIFVELIVAIVVFAVGICLAKFTLRVIGESYARRISTRVDSDLGEQLPLMRRPLLHREGFRYE